MKQRVSLFVLASAAAYFLLGQMAAHGILSSPLVHKLLWPVIATLGMGLLVAPWLDKREEEVFLPLGAAPWGAALLLMVATLWQWPRLCPEWIDWLPALLWGEWLVGLIGQGAVTGTLSLVSRQFSQDEEEKD